jgi:hypothetical protein
MPGSRPRATRQPYFRPFLIPCELQCIRMLPAWSHRVAAGDAGFFFAAASSAPIFNPIGTHSVQSRRVHPRVEAGEMRNAMRNTQLAPNSASLSSRRQVAKGSWKRSVCLAKQMSARFGRAPLNFGFDANVLDRAVHERLSQRCGSGPLLPDCNAVTPPANDSLQAKGLPVCSHAARGQGRASPCARRAPDRCAPASASALVLTCTQNYLHTKLAASSVLPLPFQCAVCG